MDRDLVPTDRLALESSLEARAEGVSPEDANGEPSPGLGEARLRPFDEGGEVRDQCHLDVVLARGAGGGPRRAGSPKQEPAGDGQDNSGSLGVRFAHAHKYRCAGRRLEKIGVRRVKTRVWRFKCRSVTQVDT